MLRYLHRRHFISMRAFINFSFISKARHRLHLSGLKPWESRLGAKWPCMACCRLPRAAGRVHSGRGVPRATGAATGARAVNDPHPPIKRSATPGVVEHIPFLLRVMLLEFLLGKFCFEFEDDTILKTFYKLLNPINETRWWVICFCPCQRNLS